MLGRIRARLSFSSIVAGLALFVAAGTGGAWAAGQIDGHDIKNGSTPAKKLTKSARKSLHGARGPRGARGPQGPGAAGINYVRNGNTCTGAWTPVYNQHGYKLEAQCTSPEDRSQLSGLDFRVTTPQNAGVDWGVIIRRGQMESELLNDGFPNSGGPTILLALSWHPRNNTVRQQGSLSLHAAGGVVTITFNSIVVAAPAKADDLFGVWGTAVFSSQATQ